MSTAPRLTTRPGSSTTPPMHAALVAAWCRCSDGRAIRGVIDAWCAVGGPSCGGPRVEGEERSKVEGEEGEERARGRRRGRRRGRGPRGGCQFCMRAMKGAVARCTCDPPCCEVRYLEDAFRSERLIPLSWWERDIEVELRRRSGLSERQCRRPQAASRGATGVGALRHDKKLRPSTSNMPPTDSHFPGTAPVTQEHVTPSLFTTSSL